MPPVDLALIVAAIRPRPKAEALSWSRMTYLHFFLDARMPSFLRGHELAFAAFGGVPRELLYDNLKSAVIERVGQAIHFNEKRPRLLGTRGCTAGRGTSGRPRSLPRRRRAPGAAPDAGQELRLTRRSEPSNSPYTQLPSHEA